MINDVYDYAKNTCIAVLGLIVFIVGRPVILIIILVDEVRKRVEKEIKYKKGQNEIAERHHKMWLKIQSGEWDREMDESRRNTERLLSR